MESPTNTFCIEHCHTRADWIGACTPSQRWAHQQTALLRLDLEFWGIEYVYQNKSTYQTSKQFLLRRKVSSGWRGDQRRNRRRRTMLTLGIAPLWPALHTKVTFVGIPVSLLDNSDRGVTCNDGCGGDLLIRTVVPCLHGHRTVVGPPLQDQLLHPRIFFLGIELECITKVLGRETLVVSSLSSPSQSCSEDSSSKRPKSQPCMFD